MRPKVLVLARYVEPAFRAGGPVRSIANLVQQLSSRYEFSIIAGDRDLGHRRALPDADSSAWVERDGYRVCHVRASPGALIGAARRIGATAHDLLYLNSVFDPLFSIVPLLARRAGALKAQPLVIAPRGELFPGSLASKFWKKRPFLALARTIDLHRGAIWQAASPLEALAIRAAGLARPWPQCADPVVVAPNLVPRTTPDPEVDFERGRSAERLALVYLSRIVPSKNLAFALEALASVRSPVTFDIHGPIEDGGYWQRCQALIAGLPDNVEVNYRGEVSPTDVEATLARYDLLLLPTRGESYGHAIREALAAGVPVLISDQTPWVELDAGGWTLPLGDPRRFASVIDAAAAWDDTRWRAARAAARQAAASQAEEDNSVVATAMLFDTALNVSGGSR